MQPLPEISDNTPTIEERVIGKSVATAISVMRERGLLGSRGFQAGRTNDKTVE